MKERKFRKGTGRASYEVYLARLRRQASDLPPCDVPVAHVFAATCTGARRSARECAVPSAVIGASGDPGGDVRGFAARRHGSCVPFTADGLTFAQEEGWSDWRLAPFGRIPSISVALAPGVRLVDGLLRVSLLNGISVGRFRLCLARSLRHMRHDDVCNRGGPVGRRIARGAPALVAPRYTPVEGEGRRRCDRVEDLYAVDPSEDVQLVAMHASAALAVASALDGPAAAG